jgi:hypothetical protein
LLDELYGPGLSPEKNVKERDAEFYVNVDVQARSVQFHEKDMKYRRGVVLSLSEDA